MAGRKDICEACISAFSQLHPRDVADMLPDEVLRKFNLCDRFFALKNIHFPENKQNLGEGNLSIEI